MGWSSKKQSNGMVFRRQPIDCIAPQILRHGLKRAFYFKDTLLWRILWKWKANTNTPCMKWPIRPSHKRPFRCLEAIISEMPFKMNDKNICFLGAGYKHFVFSPRSLGKWSTFDDFSKGLVETTTTGPRFVKVKKCLRNEALGIKNTMLSWGIWSDCPGALWSLLHGWQGGTRW